MGRHAAGAGFLDGLLAAPDLGRIVCCADNADLAAPFATAAAAAGRPDLARWTPVFRPDLIAAQTPTLVIPDPNLAMHAWRRRRFLQRGYSIVGVTHTTAMQPVMDMIAGLLDAPVQGWDALVCTSAAVRAMVERLLDERAAYLEDRFGATRIPRPRLPVIPLGVRTRDHVRDGVLRSDLRGRLGIAPDDVAFLYVGRLDALGKTNPLPMLLALGAATRAPGLPRAHLILAGWFARPAEEAQVRAAAASVCPHVVLHLLDGRNAAVKAGIRSAADVFVLLVDNVQETFGLAPVEAMAAGLPVVVTDWNGFKDTVRDGVDGFRIPTALPQPPLGLDLALGYETGQTSYDAYVGGASQFTAIDGPAAADACRRLLADPALRARMGAAGAERAAALFDWAVVLRRWRALWDELDAVRLSDEAEQAPRRADAEPVPARPDPFNVFAAWPTTALHAGTPVSFVGPDDPSAWRARLALPLAAVLPDSLPSTEEALAMLAALSRAGTLAAGDAAAAAGTGRTARLIRGLAWLAKLGLVRVG
jgi:glycosyltransferase involved in cell wall biosynthesis